jgi:hypothetical protein
MVNRKLCFRILLSNVPNLRVLHLNYNEKITEEYKLVLLKRGVTVECDNFYYNWKKYENKYA